jgi:hypothetical protein
MRKFRRYLYLRRVGVSAYLVSYHAFRWSTGAPTNSVLNAGGDWYPTVDRMSGAGAWGDTMMESTYQPDLNEFVGSLSVQREPDSGAETFG